MAYINYKHGNEKEKIETVYLKSMTNNTCMMAPLHMETREHRGKIILYFKVIFLLVNSSETVLLKGTPNNFYFCGSSIITVE